MLAIVATACSGGEDNGTGVASLDDVATTLIAPDAVDEEQQLIRFAQCMRAQGVDLPDPTVDSSGNLQLQPPPDFEPANIGELLEAAEVCQEFLEGVALGFDDIDLSAITDTLLEFAVCMRENGFDLPDPDFSFVAQTDGSIPPAGPFGDIDLQDPEFLSAFAACQDIIVDLGVPAG